MGKRRERLSRLLEIIVLLQSDEGWSGRALARRFGLSRTQVYNDIRALRETGIPVRPTAGGYRIAPSYFLPPVRLTPREVLSLLFPMELFAQTEGEREVHRSARQKLVFSLPESLRRGAGELVRRTSIVAPVSDADDETMGRLRQAVADHRRVLIVYTSRAAAGPRRLQIDPYGLAFRKHAWYVVGYSVEHREVRKFRVSRVAAVEPTRLVFTVPKGFSMEEFFRGAWYVFGGEPREIRLRFSPRVARLIRERRAHPGQRIQMFRDGSIRYQAVVRNLDEVAWWLVQYGGDAVVEHPPELRDKVVNLACDILRRHGLTVAPAAAPRRALLPEAGEAEAADRVAEGEPPPYSRDSPPPPQAET